MKIWLRVIKSKTPFIKYKFYRTVMSNFKTTMKAWQKQGLGLENLKNVEIDVPIVKDDEILIKVKAVSLNFRDKAIIDGIYLPELMKGNFIPVSDAVGEVVAVGKDVTEFKIGQRVISHLYTEWLDGKPVMDCGPSAVGGPNDGGLAEYMILKEKAAVIAPSSLTDEEASTLPIAALTNWFALVEYGKIKAGDKVLVLGTGGVSIFAIQMASALGAHVIATTSNSTKAELARKLGAKEVINYIENPNWDEEVLRLTDGVGVEHILEVVGGESINKSINAVALQGNIYVIGFLGGMMAEVNLFSLLAKQAKVQGIYVGHKRALEDMMKAFDTLAIKPIIDTVYSFDQAIEAYKHLAKGAVGKIVIKMA